MFITFEGLDGSGKTTVIKEIGKWLKSFNLDFITTREPGSNSKLNLKLRKILLTNPHHLSQMTQVLIYSIDRRLNLEKNIWPALLAKKIVLCDRYLDSTLAYQGYANDLGLKKMQQLQEIVTEKTYPNLTIFFKIPFQEVQKRVKMRSKTNYYDQKGRAFYQKVYEGYQAIIKIFPKRFKIVDASQNKEKVLEDVKKIIAQVLKLKYS